MNKPSPFIFKETRDLIERGPHFEDARVAAMIGVTTEIACFLATMGVDAGSRLEKLEELKHDVHASLFNRSERTALMLTYDPATASLHLHVSEDDDKIADAEIRASAAGHGVYATIPSRVLSYTVNLYARHH